MSRAKFLTTEEANKYIDSFKSKKGGFNRGSLANLGISWPPNRGWRRALIRKLVGITDKKEQDKEDVMVVSMKKTMPYESNLIGLCGSVVHKIDDGYWLIEFFSLYESHKGKKRQVQRYVHCDDLVKHEKAHQDLHGALWVHQRRLHTL